MPTVTFSTHCHAGDREALYANLNKLVQSHEHAFNEIQVIHQRCEIDTKNMGAGISYIQVSESDYDQYLKLFGIPEEDARADELTHGPGSPHYWKNHCVNHLAGAEHAKSDYIVFSDSDCVIIRNEAPGWIDMAIKYMEENPDCFAVSPSDGAPGRQWIMSQQLFIVNRKRFMAMDFNCWDGCPIDGGPMIEYYFMLEGRISMYMLKHGFYRWVLPDNWRYYHDWVHHKEPRHLYDMAMEKLK